MAGVFVMDGMQFGISNFTISFDQDGNMQSNPLQLTVGYDACIPWARIALSHRDIAEQKMAERRHVWADDAQIDCRSHTLEEEFRASMQAVVASVTCIEALYDHLSSFSPISEATKASWRKNRTARYIQVSETMRATLRVKPAATEALRHNLKAMYRLRDSSVHPSSKPRAPFPHPELEIHTDWRFTVFRGDVSDIVVCYALGLLWDITHGFEYRTKELSAFMVDFRKRVEKLLPDGKPTPKVANVSFKLP